MIRATLMTSAGPIVLLGVTSENVRRLEAGMPIDIDLKELTPPGTRLSRLVIAHGETHVQVVEDMRAGGIPINDEMLGQARQLDEELG